MKNLDVTIQWQTVDLLNDAYYRDSNVNQSPMIDTSQLVNVVLFLSHIKELDELRENHFTESIL